MGTQYLNTQFRLKRGTSEAWARNNPILATGEPGWATDTKVLKIGDGITHWNDLNYVVNVSDYVTEQELRDAINKYDVEIQALIESIIDDVNLAFDYVLDALGELETGAQEKFAELENAIEQVEENGRAYVDDIATDFNSKIGNIDNRAQANSTQIEQQILPKVGQLEAGQAQHEDMLDRLAGSVSYVNCLKRYDPDLIKMEYTNRAGGWKASIKNENTGEEIHGASLFTRHNVDGWQEHSVEFVNDSTTNATFQIYSVSKEPGVVQIDDVEIVGYDLGGLYHDLHCSPPAFGQADGFWVWPNSLMAIPNSHGQAVIASGKNTWDGYAMGMTTLRAGGMYYVDINIAEVNTGGINFKIVDQNGNKVPIYEASKTRESVYLNKAGTTRLYFVAPEGPVNLHFSGSNTAPEDNLVIDSCVIYQSNSSSWGEVNSTLDHGWVLNESWYNWGKNVEFDGEQTVRFSTSAEESYIRSKKRALTLDTRTYYRLEYDAYRVSGGLVVTIQDANGVVIAKQNVSKSCAEGWGHYETVFVPTTEVCTASIAMIWNETLQYDVYVKNLNIRPLEPLECILSNNSFSVDDYADGSVVKTGQANWTLGKASTIVDGTVQLAVQDGNTTTYVPGCSQAITLIPGNRYRVSFRSKSIEYTPMWMPYITFTNEDKIAFVSDIDSMGYETLRLGGPWVNGAAEHYAARVTIESGRLINAKYLYFLGAIWSSDEFEVDVKIKRYDGKIIYARQHILSGSALGTGKKYYLELPTGFQLSAGDIELTFMVNETQRNEYPNAIGGVGIVGNYFFADQEPQPDYRVDPNGRIYMNELRADRVVTNIDDGSLDWEV